MRKIIYQVASSLDGFIADQAGGYEWIVADDTIDFEELYARFDTFLMGRKTWEVIAAGSPNPLAGKRVVVVSERLTAAQGVEVIRGDVAAAVAELKREDGRDIWLYGGGELFRTCLDAGLVDEVELALIPILLGGGIPVIAPGSASRALVLQEMKRYPSGIIIANYRVPAR